LVDRSGDLDIGVPAEDLLDALPALLEKLNRVSRNVGRHGPDYNRSRTGNLTNSRSARVKFRRKICRAIVD
jgi:hypothetical protein